MAIKEIQDLLYVEAYSVLEFLGDLQTAIQAGYVIKMDTVEHFPRLNSAPYFATLTKATQQDVKKLEDEATAAKEENKTTARTARKTTKVEA